MIRKKTIRNVIKDKAAKKYLHPRLLAESQGSWLHELFGMKSIPTIDAITCPTGQKRDINVRSD
jgi:hypothetical protein